MIFKLVRHESDVLPLGKEVWGHGFTVPVRERDAGHGAQRMCPDAGQASARRHVTGVWGLAGELSHSRTFLLLRVPHTPS